MSEKLLTVIVNYRTANYVLEALEALLPQLVEQPEARVWVVDNKSPDDSLRVLEQGIAALEHKERVRLIASPVNGGFGAGNNVALREALTEAVPCDLFYLLNPDAVPDPGALSALLRYMREHPRVGIAGTFVHDPDGTPHCSSFRFPTIWSELEAGFNLGFVSRVLRDRTVHMEVPSQSGPVDWVSGASLCVRRQVLERVGLFDERFFLYFEETDLCMRARRAGYDVHFVRESSVGHIRSVATGLSTDKRTPPYWFASRRLYLEKTHGAAYQWAASLAFTLGWASFRAQQRLRGKPPLKPRFLRDFWTNTVKPVPEAQS